MRLIILVLCSTLLAAADPPRLDPAKTAVVFIEFQNEFCSPGGGLHSLVRSEMDRQRTVDNARLLLRAARHAGARVIHCPFVYDQAWVERHGVCGIIAGAGAGGLFRPGAWGTRIIDAMAPVAGETVLDGKHALSAFTNTRLKEVLAQSGVTDVVFAGFLANVCVEASARSAYEEGLRVTVCADAVAAASSQIQEYVVNNTYPVLGRVAAVREVAAAFGQPVTAESRASGDAASVRNAVAWARGADAAATARAATAEAIAALGCPAQAVVFHTYYQDKAFTPDEQSQATAVQADIAAEQAAARAVAEVCGTVPSIGCRARGLANGGTVLKDGVVVMAIGGQRLTCAVAKVPIHDDRRRSGKELVQALSSAADLRVALLFAEMRLSFEAKDGVSVEDFIAGMIAEGPRGLAVFGGNSMPDDMKMNDLRGAQFFRGEALKGHIVALGLGGPIRFYGNHEDEFVPSGPALAVTAADGKWVRAIEGRPAAEVYRETRGMPAHEVFTSDWLHPIGVVVNPNKEYVRMVLDWVDAQGRDKDGKPSSQPTGSLRFVAPVPVGTRIRILRGGRDPEAIVRSSRQAVVENLAEARNDGAVPLMVLASDCCARGMRLRTFSRLDDDEVPRSVIPAMKDLGGELPFFGFDAWGELGQIKGTYQGLSYQYQQHTFVSGVIALMP